MKPLQSWKPSIHRFPKHLLRRVAVAQLFDRLDEAVDTLHFAVGPTGNVQLPAPPFEHLQIAKQFVLRMFFNSQMVRL